VAVKDGRLKEHMPEIEGVGADAPITVNAQGGAQSHINYRFDFIPAKALAAVAQVFAIGASRYARNNWRRIPENDHLNHAMMHIFAYMAGDRSDDHLEHAACRMLMALEMKNESYDYNAFEPLPGKANAGET